MRTKKSWFLDDNLTKNIRADNIITNPPFKSAQKFVEKALTIATKKVVILQRLAFLESKERYKLFTTTPLKCIYVFSKRLNFYPNGIEDKKKSGMLAFAWFVWEQGYNKKPYINWIKGDWIMVTFIASFAGAFMGCIAGWGFIILHDED